MTCRQQRHIQPTESSTSNETVDEEFVTPVVTMMTAGQHQTTQVSPTAYNSH